MFQFSTLRSKLNAIIFTSFITRFLLIPFIPSSFGPDEGTYASAVDWTVLGKPANEFPDFGGNLYRSARALILPASFLCKLGLDSLYATKLTAAIYGLLTLSLIVYVLSKTIQKNQCAANFVTSNERTIIWLFLAYAFLPSHYIWSLLGLRESSNEFWTISSFAILYSIIHLNKAFSPGLSMLFLASIIATFNSRPQVGWVLGIAILIYLGFNFRNRTAIILIPITLIAIWLGNSTTSVYSELTQENFIATTNIKPDQDKELSRLELLAARKCVRDGQVVRIANIDYICRSIGIEKVVNGSTNPLKALPALTDSIQSHHVVNKQGAASVINPPSCPYAGESRFSRYFCIAWRAPYMTATFLFRPMIVIDVSSVVSLYAAIENVLWLGACSFVVVMFFRKRRLAFFGPLAPSLIFFILYTVGAGSYEGNMGTAFRHKSLILWVVLLLVVSVLAAKKNSGDEAESLVV